MGPLKLESISSISKENDMRLTEEQQRLLVHALAMGGWLKAGYFQTERQQTALVVLVHHDPPLMKAEVVTAPGGNQGTIVRLTPDGATVATELARAIAESRS
jgi:hypothetical protein